MRTQAQGIHLLPIFAVLVWFSVSVSVINYNFPTGSHGQAAVSIFIIQGGIKGLHSYLSHWIIALDLKAKPKSATRRSQCQVWTRSFCFPECSIFIHSFMSYTFRFFSSHLISNQTSCQASRPCPTVTSLRNLIKKQAGSVFSE